MAIFYLQLAPILPIKFLVNWPFASEEEAQNRISRWWSAWISDRNDLTIFDLQVTLILSIKFHVSWTFGFEGQPSWILDRNNFLSTMPRYFLPNFESVGLSVPEMKGKTEFQDAVILDFRNNQNLAIFYLQAALILPTKFRISWSFRRRSAQ